MDRRSVMLGNLYWGSDEDLARDVGMGIDADMLSLAGVHSPPPLSSLYMCVWSGRADVKTEELEIIGVPVTGGV